jgi:CRP-like cAMP-binding protein
MSEKSSSSARDALLPVPYFSAPDACTLDAVVQAAVRRDYEGDEVVFLEGEACAGLYVFAEGWFNAVKISPEGREQALRFVGPGEAFNEIGVFAGARNPVTVVALERGTIWLIHRETIIQLLDRHPRLARSVVENLA